MTDPGVRSPEFWTVVETGDYGDPILVVCRTQQDALEWKADYSADKRFYGDPEVRPGWFADDYPDHGILS